MNLKKTFIISTAVLLVASMALTMITPSCGDSKVNDKPATNDPPPPPIKLVPMIDYQTTNKYPHDITLFTEGFLFHDNKLLESTGAPHNLPQTKSAFGILDLKTGKLDQKVELDRKQYFGEGVVVLNNYIYQLTYTNQVGFIYDAKTYERKGQFNIKNKEGWGMTTDGKHLIMSDGTNLISYLDPTNFSVVKTLNVTENGFALDFINELEYIKGYIYANVWMTNFIVKIDPNTGEVVGKLDLNDLYNEARKENINLAEMNGIAYDSINQKVLVTGKLWPKVFEISFPY